ncbi:MAG: 50S ribosomal protein L4 [Candidatus Taylorbacteria bacterium]|nr:50S ribosomal protein L4 [Candidatus Taylorbacteria bacterium]
MEANIYTQEGKDAGKITLSSEVFGLSWNADLVYQVTNTMNSNARENIAHTKTRGEVRGGGKKPWQQKGTGRARHGSTRSPIWVGGGVAHGPRNDKNYSRKVNRKTKAKALYTILSKKFKDGEILFVDSISFPVPKTKDAKAVLASLSGVKGFEKLSRTSKNTALITLDKKNLITSKSFGNFGNIEVDELRNINPLTAMAHRFIIVVNPKEALPQIISKLSK